MNRWLQMRVYPAALIAVFAFFLHSCSQENKSKDEELLRHIKEVEWPRAYREQDTVLLDRILADEFKMIGSNGTRSSKKEQIAYIKTHKPGYQSFKFNIDRLEIFENNTAIVSGTGIIDNKDSVGPYELHYSSSNVLIKRDGKWKAISSHTSGDSIIRKN
ncbi:MAG TPA: nuclear transport factor 2 family protein [Chitinophagaceae bacterium]|nr:nuclear transport factor 2 family protein [Chitinophagaceae bacterium]